MIVGEGIVANSGGGSAGGADVYVYGAPSSGNPQLTAVVDNLFTCNANHLIALKSGNYLFEGLLSASSNWTQQYIDSRMYWTVAYVRTGLRLYINQTYTSSWAPVSTIPSAGAGNPYQWSGQTTIHLDAGDVVNFDLALPSQTTQYGGIIIRITEV